jgi:hypothetical protein
LSSDQLSKFFDSTLTKLTSPLLMQTSSPINVSIYITKFLAAPFKHIELYVKLLKEIHRYSEVSFESRFFLIQIKMSKFFVFFSKDYHVDRGDVQRCVEFYSELSVKYLTPNFRFLK